MEEEVEVDHILPEGKRSLGR